MDILRIQGPARLCGEVHIQGSKNAALPMIAAAVLSGGKTVLENCPDIADIRNSVDILNAIGCTAVFSNNTLTINSSGSVEPVIPENLMGRLRSSFLFAGALLARCKRAEIAFPGGCAIGGRPIDIHLDAFKKLGAAVKESENKIVCTAEKINPQRVNLRFPSVGATENIMIFSALSGGVTEIANAACEPEICDLQNMLNAMGADICGAGTPFIRVRGVKRLADVKYRIMPDRVVCATYLTALACTKGCIRLKGADIRHISPYVSRLCQMGIGVHREKSGVVAEKTKRLTGFAKFVTMPYPGFATDMQSLAMAALCTSRGVGVIQENIFENRMCLVRPLLKMGADIKVVGKSASVKGVCELLPTNADACDLRSGAALAAAMLSADGVSYLGNVCYIDRGYENFEKCLSKLGAKVERIEKSG